MKDSAEFFLRDYSATLFPLKTNHLLVEKYATQLRSYIQEQIVDAGSSFQNQQRVFANKRGWFVRRTVKLDPVAEFFLYDIVYRNRALFRKSCNAARAVFGFRIEKGEPVSTLESYVDFKREVASSRSAHGYYAYFDVASYFNHIYHHDLVRWFEDVGAQYPDLGLFGRFLRETSSGRSVDCLPQGLYPAKMIGASFLSFLEASNRMRSAKMLRLMDDTWIFDDDPKNVVSDFVLAQGLLGDKGLSINDRKSMVLEGRDAASDLPAGLDRMKIDLLRKRRNELRESEGYGEDDEENPDSLVELTGQESEYLLTLLRHGDVQEEDAELVLTLMREHSVDVMEYLPTLISEFPALSKKIYQFCGKVADKASLTDTILRYVSGPDHVTEFQLFWFGMIAESLLMDTRAAGELLRVLYEHERATSITKAKILEIADNRFGLPDLREEQLRAGNSDWLAWAAAVGSRAHAKGHRNQILKYFRKSSAMNRLIGEFVETCF